MKKSRHGFARIAHQVAKSTRWSITAKIVRAEAAQGKTNQGTLCLKGYYGWDFINDTQILTPRLKNPHDPSPAWRQTGSRLRDEALDYVATRLGAIKEKNMARTRSRPPAPPAGPVMKPTT